MNHEGDNAMKTNEVYQSVTDTIIRHLEDHLEKWNRPWVAFGVENDYAKNTATNTYYRGIN
jgi:antirestriction protein ArdC